VRKRVEPAAPAGAGGLAGPVTAIKGVGPAVAKALARRGLASVDDLLHFIPLRHEDESRIIKIADVVEGEENVVMARIIDSGTAYSRATRRKIYHARLEDDTGAIVVKWFRFNKGWMAGICKKGNTLLLNGKVSRYGAELQMVHPRITVLDEARGTDHLTPIIPVYPQLEGVRQGVLRNIVEEAFRTCGSCIESIIPERLEQAHGLPGLRRSLEQCHFPDAAVTDDAAARYRSRLVLEEFFLFQLSLLLRRSEVRKEKGIAMQPGESSAHLTASMPFRLTAGQERARQEIAADMAAAEPMNRLLQGDVGCGKTVCAVLAAAAAVDSGRQVAFMAPTELLAEQHYLHIHGMLEAAGVRVVLLRGNMGKQREAVVNSILKGDVQVVVGTHAMLQEDVRFHRLGLIVIDEQHRFGVIQRGRLREKGVNPDILVMSATPIPRTLSMVVYGDLDVSTITDMPEHRQKVATHCVAERQREEVYRTVEAEIGRGHQAFVVYPLLEESEDSAVMGAKESLARLQARFPAFRTGLLHGRMKAEEKEAIMVDFRQKKLDLLVCTTVIEVGIDVPNATLMIVEHAERFGLSQLHQLRGRVGRGTEASRCFLVGSEKRTTQASRRLRVLERTTDGFVIAEEDMKLRGPGDMMGVRQAGMPEFRHGNILTDGHLMSQARRMAEESLAAAGSEETARFRAAADARWGTWLHLGDIA
jgi:ATP-dependent DNA helicase RecG